MQRETKSYRLHPVVVQAIKAQAKDLRSSAAYVVEWMAAELLKHRLPGGFAPGQEVEDKGE